MNTDSGSQESADVRPEAEKQAAQDDASQATDRESKGRPSESTTFANAIKEVLNSEGAANMAEIVCEHLLKAKELEVAARDRAAASYHRGMVRWSYTFLAALGLCLGVILLVVWMLKGEKDLLLPVLSSLIALIAGTGGGLVFGRRSAATRE